MARRLRSQPQSPQPQVERRGAMWLRKIIVATLALVMGSVMLTLVAAGGFLLLISNGALEIPQLRDRVAQQLAERFDAPVKLDRLSFARDPDSGQPQLRALGVDIRGPDGAALIRLPEVRTKLALRDILRGKLRPAQVELKGLTLRAKLHPDGRFDLGENFGESNGEFSFARFERLMRTKGGSALEQLILRDSTLLVQDVGRGRSWVMVANRIGLRREGDDLSLRGALGFDRLGQVSVTATHRLGSGRADIRAQVAHASPAVLAQVLPPLEWLAMIDAQVSGSASFGLSEEGVTLFSGVLDLGQGHILNTPATQPIRFDKAKTYFEYDVARAQMRFPAIEVETQIGRFRAEGYAQLETRGGDALDAMTGQFNFTDVQLWDPDLLVAPIDVSQASLDMRLTLAPLVLEVGALTAHLSTGVLQARGRSEVRDDAWHSAYDLEIDALSRDSFIGLWPKLVIHKTRAWVDQNVRSGTVRGLHGGVRIAGAEPPRFSFDFAFEDAEVLALDALPPIQKAAGFGTLTQDAFRLRLSSGGAVAPGGGWVNLAGSEFFVPDINVHPTPGEITLRSQSGIASALEMLNVERFQFLDKVGLSAHVATGDVTAQATLKLPLEKSAKASDVIFDVTAQVAHVVSDRLAPGRRLKGRDLVLRADNAGVEIQGPAELDNVPLRFNWSMPLGAATPQSQLIARLSLTDANLRRLGVSLPIGFLNGTTDALFEMDLRKGQVPEFRLTSALVGARMSLPQLGWAKSANQAGTLDLRGRLTEPLEIEHLHLQAAGLSVTGDLRLSPANTLEVLRLETIKLGQWLDASARLQPNGRGLRIAISDGVIDLRHIGALDQGGHSGSSSAETTQIDVSLDRLIVTQDIALSGFSAKLDTASGLRGDFVARVNGGPLIEGKIFPHQGGTGVELNSNQAGAVVQAAGLLDNAREGDMKIVILPRVGSEAYDGVMQIQRVRLQQSNGIANLLNAVSVVGLVQQLEGEGIHFDTVEGKFELYPDYVRLHDVSAVGPSMGLTLDGIYDTNARTVNLEGVATPLYLINGLFQAVLGPLGGRRKGEGLFSFTYTMQGPSDDPSVGVNPFSLLTPGAFREIFRRPPPTRPGQTRTQTPTRAPGQRALQNNADQR